MKLRTAIVMPTFFPKELDFVGGGDRYAFNAARALVPHCEVTLVTFGPRPSERRLDGMRHVIARGSGRDLENPLPWPGPFLRERFDVIHVYQLRSAVTSVLALIAKARRTPLVVTDVGGGGRSLMFRAQLYRLVRRYILISDFSRRILPPAVWPRASVIKGGIELSRFPYETAVRKRQVLQVGRIMPHKGINYTIEAAGSDIPVVIAGRVKDADYYRYLQEQSRGKQVTFITDADDATVHELYRTSSVTVGASVYRDLWGRVWANSELLGLTMLESMAVGTPVVCTAVGGMPEYVIDGVTGFIVPPNDTWGLRKRLLELLGDSKRAQEMGLAGNKHVQQFSWVQVAERVATEYRRLVRPGRVVKD